ncbi:MAG: hydratase [Clostridiales bacterium]|nr:hydratase [Clostridiales bacterium]
MYLSDKPVYLINGSQILSADSNEALQYSPDSARKGTIAYSIISSHNTSGDEISLKLKFDALTSHDITYVGIIQTALASGIEKFPIPYVLTNCHNSLCAVGGTINEDDHVFGLSAAQRFGGIYVPPHLAVIHQFMREMYAGCGKMILGSDSHTRYGALGTMAIGEGGPELVKQLLSKTYDVKYPPVIMVYLEGAPRNGVGPHDVALALVGAVFSSGFAKNCILEFVGPGVKNLSADSRCGIDVMTTETTCLSSIWETDETIHQYYKTHGRADAYKKLSPASVAYYDKLIKINLSEISPMIALPFHPSNVYTIDEFNANAADILRKVEIDAKDSISANYILTDKVSKQGVKVTQGVVAGCSGGTFENIAAVADIVSKYGSGCADFTLDVYPQSQPVYYALNKNMITNTLMQAGAIMKTAFCGPCFGAGDVPANNTLSIRHTTRNFPNREGSKPSGGQAAGVALMDARSIAATAASGGYITSAEKLDIDYSKYDYEFNGEIYNKKVYSGFNSPDSKAKLITGPNIIPWPEIPTLADNLVVYAASVLTDDVTTTDELIPSGETSSYRSNPLGLAEFTLSRKDPKYVERAKNCKKMYDTFRSSGLDEISEIIKTANLEGSVSIGSFIYANKPGDGSAREQAASCQRVLGGWANIAKEYATKRYRSNCINWGMLPFIYDGDFTFEIGDAVVVKNVKSKLLALDNDFDAIVIRGAEVYNITLKLPAITKEEAAIIKSGCLMNFYKGL